MKKYLSLFAAALLTLGFAACSDVPAPYGINDDDIDNPSGNGGTVQTLPFAESFASSLGGFTSYAVSGDYNWVKQTYGGGCATASSYDSSTKTNNPAEIWLVSPTFDFTGITAAHISFDYALVYAEAAHVATHYLLKASANYEAGNEPGTAEWTTIPMALTSSSSFPASGSWPNSGNINIPEDFLNKSGVTFALVYISTTKAATWEVNNIKIEEGEGETFGPTEPDTPQPVEGVILEAPFNSALTSNLGDFITWDEKGSGYNWTYNSTYKCAYMTSYDSPSKTNNAADSWLISPNFDLTGVTAAYVSFDYKLAYASGNNSEYKVLVGQGFPGAGASPGRINWTELPVTWTTLTTFSGASWSTTGKLAIPEEFLGKENVCVAIEYISTTKAATWEIQNLVVAQGEGDTPGGNDDPNDNPGGNTDPGDVTGESVTVEAASLGLGNAAELTTYNLNEGISWSFAQNEGSNSPKYYNVDKSARLYAQNSVTIASLSGRKIKAVIFNCSPTYNGTNYRGNEQMTASTGTITKDATAETVTVSGVNAAELTVKNAFTSNSAGTQLRIVSMQVVFEDGTVATVRRR
ncbi:MAG: choice-of-anchor J domain-containing protein [Bacteroidaceae bacterium]|nr:choice-of-anchor J domain-containing protein [Bacteroidaceae bacterium]